MPTVLPAPERCHLSGLRKWSAASKLAGGITTKICIAEAVEMATKSRAWVSFLPINPNYHRSKARRAEQESRQPTKNVSTLGRMIMKSTPRVLVICSSVRSFTRTPHSFACSALLALLACSAALILPCSLTHSLLGSWEKGIWL